MNSLPRTLYKYFPPERIDVLTTRLIRYTPFGAFNDPFEGRPSITTLTSKGEARKVIREITSSEVKQAYDSLTPEQRAELPYEAFSDLVSTLSTTAEPELFALLAESTPQIMAKIFSKFDESIGILSLSEVPDSLLMWSHYAGSHTGFVLGFDPQHPYFNKFNGQEDEFRHLRRVMYRETRPGGVMSALDGSDLFLVKSGHWDYEREWRILRPLAEATLTKPSSPFSINLFEFPPSALQELIIGARTSEITKHDLVSTIRNDAALQHIRIRQSVPHDEHFMLKFADIDTQGEN